MAAVLKIAVRLLVALVALVIAAVAYDLATYDAAAWRRDFEHLKREMAQRYANLDWMVERRRIDLQALDAQTAASIDNATSHWFAYQALRRFIRTFEDPHLRLVWSRRWSTDTQAQSATVSSCEDAGYEETSHAIGAPFTQFAGWAAVADGHFPTGAAGEVAVLRIASFGEGQYLAACKAVFRSGLTERDLQLAVRARLQGELKAAIAAVKARGVRKLVVDITGNGGGSEWVQEVVPLFTARTLTRRPARHVDPQCDRSAVWQGASVCTALAPQGEPVSITGSGEWTGDLVIAADRHTASAAEDFVVWLQQNGAAVVMGERTLGAGCGYVDGGGRIELTTIPFDVMAPNCARFLNDGTNEIEGIRPDIEGLRLPDEGPPQ